MKTIERERARARGRGRERGKERKTEREGESESERRKGRAVSILNPINNRINTYFLSSVQIIKSNFAEDRMNRSAPSWNFHSTKTRDCLPENRFALLINKIVVD